MKVHQIKDAEKVAEIKAAIKANDGYCPCQLEKSVDTRCICKAFLEQGLGECHCGLYVKTEL